MLKGLISIIKHSRAKGFTVKMEISIVCIKTKPFYYYKNSLVIDDTGNFKFLRVGNDKLP